MSLNIDLGGFKPRSVQLQDWEGKQPFQSNENYHADKTCISSSELSDFFKYGPEYFKEKLDGNIEKSPSESMKLGTALHDANLEGLIDKFVVGPKFLSVADRKKAGDKDLRAVSELKKEFEQKCISKNLQVVTQAQYDTIHESHRKFNSCKEVQKIKELCNVEVSYKYLHSTGLKFKFRPDLINLKDYEIYDYKTTSCDLTKFSLAKECISKNYILKAAHYLVGAERIYNKEFSYSWLFQSTQAPHGLFLLRLSKLDKLKSIEQHDKVSGELARRMEKKNFQNFVSMKMSTSFPEYAFSGGWIDDLR